MNAPKKTSPRWRRWLKRTAQGGVLSIAALAVVTLRPVDHRAWLETKMAQDAKQDAQAMQRELEAARPAPLEAGWATVPLDPRIGDPMAGYGARRGAASVGVDDPLFAHALFLKAGGAEVILVGVDALLVHAGVARETFQLCAAQGIPEKAIYFTATHTHCGPGAWGPNAIEQAVCGKYDEQAVHRLARVLAQVIAAAHDETEPAEWAWLEMAVPEHVRNRTSRGRDHGPFVRCAGGAANRWRRDRRVCHLRRARHLPRIARDEVFRGLSGGIRAPSRGWGREFRGFRSGSNREPVAGGPGR
jgi:hypothetical protein